MKPYHVDRLIIRKKDKSYDEDNHHNKWHYYDRVGEEWKHVENIKHVPKRRKFE